MGRVALVTGGTRGIGAAIAIALKNAGRDVVVNYAGNDHAAREFEEATGIKTMKFDVSDHEAVAAAAAQIEKDLGPIEILVNNAGITRDTLLMRMSEEQWDEIMQVNLKSCFNLTKAVLRTMLKARAGSIINMSSVVGIQGNAGQANYAASKAGILGFTKSVALELGSRNIRCNAIAPGFIETEMTDALDEATVQGWRDAIPLKRGGQPKDVADACVFLGSDMSAYITGQTLSVDGGMRM